jgi:hypothetical protein
MNHPVLKSTVPCMMNRTFRVELARFARTLRATLRYRLVEERSATYQILFVGASPRCTMAVQMRVLRLLQEHDLKGRMRVACNHEAALRAELTPVEFDRTVPVCLECGEDLVRCVTCAAAHPDRPAPGVFCDFCDVHVCQRSDTGLYGTVQGTTALIVHGKLVRDFAVAETLRYTGAWRNDPRVMS